MVPAKTSLQSIDASAARWARELHQLCQAVESEPDGPSVWLAKIRIDIFEYLLSRYGEGTVDLDREQPGDSPTTSRQPSLPLEPKASLAGTSRGPLWASPAKPKPEVRSHLKNITEANAPRYRDYERARIDLLYKRLETTEQINSLVESILERHRHDDRNRTLNDFEFAQLIRDEIKQQFR